MTKFEAGDCVQNINLPHFVFTVNYMDPHDDKFFITTEGGRYRTAYYKLFKEKPNPQKFEVGDIVRCIDSTNSTVLERGSYYEVLDTQPSYILIGAAQDEAFWYNDKYFDHNICAIPESDFKNLAKDKLPSGITGKTNLDEKAHLAYFDPHLKNEMGIGMRYGAKKHGWNNHRTMNAEASQHIVDAIERHLNAYLRGQQYDEDMKINHLACVINNINFLYRLDRLFGYDKVLENIYGETK